MKVNSFAFLHCFVLKLYFEKENPLMESNNEQVLFQEIERDLADVPNFHPFLIP